MNTLREMAWSAVSFELEAEGGYTGAICTVSDVVTTVREWYADELAASGVNVRFIETAARAVLDEVEARGWNETRHLLRQRSRRKNPRIEPAT